MNCMVLHRVRYSGATIRSKVDAGYAQCGSELAREGGGTGNTDASWPTAIASKLAPTGEWWCT
ncbi:hypothetical protein EMIT0P228_30222 [Pseudomonas brassicacearum]